MKVSVIARLKRLCSWPNTESEQASDRDGDRPDTGRRMLLIGGVALVGSSLLLPGVIPSAEAHSRRRSRRRGWRGHRHHSRRRSRYRYHRRRRSRYYYHGRRRSDYEYYDYHNRRRSRRGGVEFYFGF